MLVVQPQIVSERFPFGRRIALLIGRVDEALPHEQSAEHERQEDQDQREEQPHLHPKIQTNNEPNQYGRFIELTMDDGTCGL